MCQIPQRSCSCRDLKINKIGPTLIINKIWLFIYRNTCIYNNFFKALRTVNICIFKNLSQIIQIMCSVLDSNVSLLDEDLISIFSLAAWKVQKSSRLLNGNLFPTDFDFFNWPRTPSKCSPESLCLRLKLRRTKIKLVF